MTLCFNEATTLECSSLERDLELCEKNGFRLIELRQDTLNRYLKKHTVDDLKAYFDTHYIKPCSFNAILGINFLTDKEWETVLSNLAFFCEIGQKLNCRNIVVCPTVTANKKTDNKAVILNDTVAALVKLASICEAYGMRIAFEPVGIGGSYVRTVEFAWEIVKTTKCKNVGLTIDSFNLYLYGKLNSFEVLQMLDAEKIYVVHFVDGDDQNLPLETLDQCHRSLPGTGKLNLKNFVDNLRKIKYDDMLSVETFRPEYWKMDPEIVIKRSYETAAAFLK
jgi:2-keto-myo-inositol isomerase